MGWSVPRSCRRTHPGAADLTRARTTIAQARTKEIGRLETLLEDAGIKLSSVACEITGVSGRAMLEALIAGQRDPAVLADLAKRQLRKKIPALTEALQGRFNDHHAFMGGCIWIASTPTRPTSPAWMPASRKRSNPFNPPGTCS